MISEQGVSNGLGHELAHGTLGMELHFSLRRMNVHINPRGIEFEEQTTDWKAALCQGGVIGLHKRVAQPAVLDWAAVYKEVLILARGP